MRGSGGKASRGPRVSQLVPRVQGPHGGRRDLGGVKTVVVGMLEAEPLDQDDCDQVLQLGTVSTAVRSMTSTALGGDGGTGVGDNDKVEGAAGLCRLAGRREGGGGDVVRSIISGDGSTGDDDPMATS